MGQVSQKRSLTDCFASSFQSFADLASLRVIASHHSHRKRCASAPPRENYRHRLLHLLHVHLHFYLAREAMQSAGFEEGHDGHAAFVYINGFEEWQL